MQQSQALSAAPPRLDNILAQFTVNSSPATALSRKEATFSEIDDLYVREYLQQLVKMLLRLESGNVALSVGYNIVSHPDIWYFWVENLVDRVGTETFSMVYSLPSRVQGWKPIADMYVKAGKLWIELRPCRTSQPTAYAPPLLQAPPPPQQLQIAAPVYSTPMPTPPVFLPAPDTRHRDRSPSRARDADDDESRSDSSSNSSSESTNKARSGNVLASVARFVLGVPSTDAATQSPASRSKRPVRQQRTRGRK